MTAWLSPEDKQTRHKLNRSLQHLRTHDFRHDALWDDWIDICALEPYL